MKSMSCKQLGGACDKVFSAETFEGIAEQSKMHGMEMFQKSDSQHMGAMQKIQALMAEEGAMKKWMAERRQEFDALPED